MSEYQYYEFAAVDRPLDGRELAQVRALSTRAQITSTSFVNTYQWGDFRGILGPWWSGTWSTGASLSSSSGSSRPGCRPA